MSKILLINTRPTRQGVTLELDPRVRSYFDALENRGPKYGDTRTEPNNGLLILGNVLRHAGHQAEYLDVNAEDYWHFVRTGRFLAKDAMVELIKSRAADCDFLFFSAIVVGIDEALWAIDRLKEAYPEKIMALGGSFPSLMPDYCLERCRGLDALIVGEGELITPELVEAYQKGDFRELGAAQGIAFREETGRGHTWRPGFNIVDLAPLGDLAMPDWTLLPQDMEGHVYRVMTSRGCGFRCKFCVPSHMSGHQVRHYDREVILAALRRVKHEQRASNYVIGDLTFFFDPARSKDILRLVAEEGIGLPFWCQTHLSRVKRENLELLAKAGCKQLAVGVESINASILANINKCIDAKEIVRKLLLVKEYGIEVQTYFIVGLPGDNLDTIRLNRQFIAYGIQQGFIDRTHLGVYVPYPGLPEETGISKESDDYRFYTQGVFRDIPATPVFSLPDISQPQVEEAFREALGQVGGTLAANPMRSLQGISPRQRQTILLGSEVVSLLHRLEGAAQGGELKVVNVVQGMRQGAASFVSPHLQSIGGFAIGNLELTGEIDWERIFRQLDGGADVILVDADQKNRHSPGFLQAARRAVKQSKLLFYSDVQAWSRAVLHLILFECDHDLTGKRIRLLSDNILTRNLAHLLAPFGPEVEVLERPSLADAQKPCDALVGFSLGDDKPGEEIFQQIQDDGIIIDAGIGSFQERIYQAAAQRGIFILRPDMRTMIASEVFQGLEYENFRRNSFGVQVKGDLTLVAGGIVGSQGSIVVDSALKPRYIFGFANGKGSLMAQDEIGSEGRHRLLRVQEILAAGEAG